MNQIKDFGKCTIKYIKQLKMMYDLNIGFKWYNFSISITKVSSTAAVAHWVWAFVSHAEGRVFES